MWALTAHGDRQLPRTDGGPDGPPTDPAEDEHVETLDLDEDDGGETVADISDVVADTDDTAGILGIQMVGAQSTPLASAFTDTDMEMQPLREQARDEGLRPPLLPDEELWIGPDDNPLLGGDAARATWSELQAWGESHEALDGPATDDDGLGLWAQAAHVPTLDGLNALEGPAVTAGLRPQGPAPLGPDPYGPESHRVHVPHLEAPPEAPRRQAAPPKRRKKRKRKRRAQVLARALRRNRAALYILIASITIFLSALLLFLAVMLR